MPNVTYISSTGETTTIDVPMGTTVMENAIKNGIDGIVAECGGAMLCATCHVYVDPAYAQAIPQMTADENDVLDGASHRRETSRLSCQMTFRNELSGLKVEIAPAD